METSTLRCFMGIFGLKFKERVLKNCRISGDLPSLFEIGFLVGLGSVAKGSGFGVIRERWIQEFLTLVYNERKSYFEIAYDVSSLHVEKCRV
jgi:hypothetical protein